ncbi:MAG: succinyldiaminopimelate transaminase [Propionibacteriaceae bacterium]|nr:succinyldiaminopimelate transaminase [Propionibacteriaceae bacterium]
MSAPAALPDFPWDSLASAKAKAAAHQGGLVDLSVGTPVDPTPPAIQRALARHADAPGYPTVWGTPRLRGAVLSYLTFRWGAPLLREQCVMPVVGTKELVAWLPTLLGLGPDDLVVIPEVAYPTYEVGARLARARIVSCDDPGALRERPSLIWINSPGNPHGQIWSAEQTSRWIGFAREHGALLASDECYGEFGWTREPVSVLDERLCGGDPTGLLAVHSLSKRSNMAGYRAGFVAGDAGVVQDLVAVRKHAGMMVPAPVQEAMVVALGDQGHVTDQRERYASRREALIPALEAAGFRIDHSEGSLYLWATRDEPCRDTIDFLAGHGILAAPGDFYGQRGGRHVRIALTATDERVAAAVDRLSPAV